jgi:uncharacterized protein (DUF952 family)
MTFFCSSICFHSTTMLYRIAEAADWQQAQETGFFTSADLAADGFLHSSEPHQILETARRYYAGRADLYLLEWDEAVLAASQVRVEREWVASRGAAFAHVFGTVPLAAVRRVWAFGASASGEFQLPDTLVIKE